MNRSQGATTGAAVILAAGAFLRPAPQTGVPASIPAAMTQSASLAKTTGIGSATEGPWIASCQYWAPVRVGLPATEPAPPDISLTLSETGRKFDSHLQVSAETKDSRCDGSEDPWGIPANLPDGTKPEITAIVAAVPDPERGHLELDFDRSVDALMQAASDNGYVGSYFWLPWKPANERQLKSTSARAVSGEEDSNRLKQPGLIVLKYGSPTNEDSGLSFRRVVYVFLVAATPTQGVDGTQLQNAFRYEAKLQSQTKASLSMRPHPGQLKTDEMDLILFKYSGAAASMRAGIEATLATAENKIAPLHEAGIRTVSIAGATSTEIAGSLLNDEIGDTTLNYHSFAESTSLQQAEVTKLFQDEWRGCDRIAFLTEDGTVFGNASNTYQGEPEYEDDSSDVRQRGRHHSQTDNPILHPCLQNNPLVLNYPRDISSLRNATAREGEKNKDQADPTSAPYLHFSLKDANAGDSVPHFSDDQTPLSQEAQLMAIGRRLVRSHVRTIAITASNVLDELFLAQFLHRACPDARLVFLDGGDLLVEREIDNIQFVGAITISPYNLVNLDHAYISSRHMRAFPDSQSEAYYNASSFVFWDGIRTDKNQAPWLAGYPLVSRANNILRPLLWATAVGRDGYYPLGILDQCASNSESILPDISTRPDTAGSPSPCYKSGDVPVPFENGVRIYPSLFWFALCILVILLCVGHSAVLFTANFWSPLTRDLAIESSDMPRRRAVYVNIATAMLFCLGFVVAYPLFPVFRASMWTTNAVFWAALTLVAASVSLIATAIRTVPHIWAVRDSDIKPEEQALCNSGASPRLPRRKKNLYPLLHGIALLTLIFIPVLWAITCQADVTIGTHTFAGLFFSYRCLHPESGVSPILPIVLLLFAWYLWGLCHTLRLRFSVNGRPQLPCKVEPSTLYPLYVPDEALNRCESSQDSCLYRNITCLLITREIIRRFLRPAKSTLDFVLVVVYFMLFTVVVIFVHVQSLDHFLWNVGKWPTLYEFLIRAMFFPLMVVALTGWVRVVFIWNSLRRGLLEPLERLPIRFAFTRLKGVAWMTMLRQGGLEEYWRDMARSTESMRQMIHTKSLKEAILPKHASEWADMEATYRSLKAHIDSLIALRQDKKPQRRKEDKESKENVTITQPVSSREFLVGDDIPSPEHCGELNLMGAIERDYARFCELLLHGLLVPYWEHERTGFVEGEPMEMMPIKAKRAAATAPDALELHASPHNREEEPIRYAEEFLAIRYVSVIRAVLVNLRYLMIFVSMAFVLATLAWNSYPFRPRQWVDWMFTSLLIILGAGVIWVFAQMYRNPILSRITDTSANELGVEFYLRLATFGAVPLLTWLASQFPVIGSSLFHFLKPGLEVVK